MKPALRFVPLALVSTFAACVACGPARAPVVPSEQGCRAARALASHAWADVAERARDRASRIEATPAERTARALDRHRRSLIEAPREVSADEVIVLSNQMMDALDELSGALDSETRDTAEDAAEALLQDRATEIAPVRAADATDAMLGALHADRAARVRRWTALEELAEMGDEIAARFETTSRQTPRLASEAARWRHASDEGAALSEALIAAGESSAEVPAACGWDRQLAVP